MMTDLRRTEIDNVGDVPWGTHICHFYETKQDLLESLIPYFKVGLEGKEYCLWMTSDPLTVEEARVALRQAIPDLDRYLGEQSMEIIPQVEWFLQGGTGGTFDLDKVIKALRKKLDQALARGYPGMRISGNPAWIGEKGNKALLNYERAIDRLMAGQPMLAACTFQLATIEAVDIFEVVRTHQFVGAMRHGNWEVVETLELKQTKAELKRLNEKLEQLVNERTRDLAATNEELRMEINERKRAEEELFDKTKALEESNIALKVLLDHNKKDQKEFEATIVSNIKDRIVPYVEKLKQARLDKREMVFIEIIERGFHDIVSPFTRSIALEYSHLTPKEIQIINLIREGKTTKEIAEILNIGKRTVDTHRDNIRSKLGISDKKVNLRTHLLSISNT